ncbi:MAG TPA: hypothetical protein VGI75_16125, partial [Pirellulales bacterium]
RTNVLVKNDRHLIREVFVALWRRMEWPVQQMGFAEWDCLAGITLAVEDLRDKPPESQTMNKRIFPGRVVVERSEDEITLRREAV